MEDGLVGAISNIDSIISQQTTHQPARICSSLHTPSHRRRVLASVLTPQLIWEKTSASKNYDHPNI